MSRRQVASYGRWRRGATASVRHGDGASGTDANCSERGTSVCSCFSLGRHRKSAAMSPVRRSAAEKKNITRIATGCAVVYGSGFLVSGLFFIYLALTAEADPDDRMGYSFALLMGAFFTIGGSVMLFNIRREYGDLQVASELESAAPGRPWMWRSDWAAGYSVEVLRERHQQQWLWAIG